MKQPKLLTGLIDVLVSFSIRPARGWSELTVLEAEYRFFQQTRFLAPF